MAFYVILVAGTALIPRRFYFANYRRGMWTVFVLWGATFLQDTLCITRDMRIREKPRGAKGSIQRFLLFPLLFLAFFVFLSFPFSGPSCSVPIHL